MTSPFLAAMSLSIQECAKQAPKNGIHVSLGKCRTELGNEISSEEGEILQRLKA